MLIFPQWKWLLAACFMVIAGCVPSVGPPPGSDTEQSPIFRSMAKDVAKAIPGSKQVALRPFRLGDQIPIPVDIAHQFNDHFAAALLKESGGRLKPVARRELLKLFEESEAFDPDLDFNSFLNKARADIALFGHITSVANGINLSYKAFDPKTSQQLASVGPWFIPYKHRNTTGVPLDEALQIAATQLAKQTPDLQQVRTVGIFFHDSDAQPAFGRFVNQALVGHLRQRIHDLENDPARILAQEWGKIPTLKTETIEKSMLGQQTGVYLLSGTYWIFDQVVKLQLDLKGRNAVHSTQVTIRRDTIPTTLPLIPSFDAALKAKDTLGSIAIRLSSDRGARPVYTIGDLLKLAVETSLDGYLFCFNRASLASGGAIVKIFPNTWHTKPRINGRKPLHIPGDRMDFQFRVHGPPGMEAIRCYVLDRDPGNALPRDIAVDNSLNPLAINSMDDLDKIFASIPGVSVSSSTLVLTIQNP